MDVVVALASSERTLWYVTLAVGLVVALVVAGMLITLLGLLGRIQAAVTACSAPPGRSPRTPRTSRNSRPPRPSSSRLPRRAWCKTAI